MPRPLAVLPVVAAFLAAAPAAPVPKTEPLVHWSATVEGMLSGAWTPDGGYVLTAGWAKAAPAAERTGVVLVWDAATGKVAHTLRGAAATYGFLNIPPAVSPDGKTVAACGGPGRPTPRADWSVEVWGWGADKPRLKLGGFESIGTGVAFSPDGATLAGVDMTGNLRAWDPATGKLRWEWEPGPKHRRKFYAPAFDPGGRVLGVSLGSEFAFFDAKTGKPRGRCEVEERLSNVQTWAFSPDGKRVAAGGSSAAGGIPLAVFDVTVPAAGDVTVTNVRAVAAGVLGETHVARVAFSPDGRHVAVVGGDGKVRLFDAVKCGLTAVAHEHTGAVTSAVFSRDGKRLLTVGRDAVKVWSVAELLKRKPG